MVVWRSLRWDFAQRKGIEDVIAQQQRLVSLLPKDRFSRLFDPFFQVVPMPAQHQLEQFRHRFRVLLDLQLGRRVKDRQAGVDMPFARVDPQHQVGLDVLNAAHVPMMLPRELIVCAPGRPHAQESRVGHGLRVCGDLVMFQGREIDLPGLETGQDSLNEVEAFLRSAVFDDDEGLASGIDFRTVQGVAGYNLHVQRKVFLKREHFRRFARSLSAYDGALFGGW